MPRLRTKGTLLLAVLLMTTAISCGSIPKPPDVMFCVIDLPRQQGVCAFSEREGTFRVPLSELDGSVAFMPEEFGKMIRYRKQLQDYIRDSRGRN